MNKKSSRCTVDCTSGTWGVTAGATGTMTVCISAGVVTRPRKVRPCVGNSGDSCMSDNEERAERPVHWQLRESVCDITFQGEKGVCIWRHGECPGKASMWFVEVWGG